jgi:predicted RNA-binding Zn-ribbon protein involved in translation (DUF1610 family)
MKLKAYSELAKIYTRLVGFAVVKCPQCRSRIQVDEEYVRKEWDVWCPDCGEWIVVECGD